MRGVALGFACALVLACAGQSALEADRAYQAGLASVERIDVRATRDTPVTVHVDVFGTLPDACTRLDRAVQERRAAGIAVSLTTRRDSGADCAAGAQPFQRSVMLDVAGLAPGLYFVSVNGVEGSFQIFEDLGAPDRYERQRNW